MLFPKDEKIEKMGKRLDKLEKVVDRKFNQIESSFKLFRDIIIKLQSEKEELEKDRDFLIEKQKEVIRRIPIHASGLQGLVEPVKNGIKENTELIRKIAKEDID